MPGATCRYYQKCPFVLPLGGEKLRFEAIDPFTAEMDGFAQCILGNRPSRVSGEKALRDVRIMLAIYEAARTGKAVKLA